MGECQHSRFEVRTRIIVDGDGGLAAYVKLRCLQCGTPFRFLGETSTASFDAEELRCSIAPAAPWTEAEVGDRRDEIRAGVDDFIHGLPPMPPPPPAPTKQKGTAT